MTTRRATLTDAYQNTSELARMLADRRTVGASPRVLIKMVKPGELQFEVETTPDTNEDDLMRAVDNALAAAAKILKDS